MFASRAPIGNADGDGSGRSPPEVPATPNVARHRGRHGGLGSAGAQRMPPARLGAQGLLTIFVRREKPHAAATWSMAACRAREQSSGLPARTVEPVGIDGLVRRPLTPVR